MAWRYTASSYAPRDRSASRDSGSTVSKYGLSSTYTSADRPSRWSSQSSREPTIASRSNSIEEHGPVWARASTLNSNPSSLVQRLKDRYSTSELQKTPSLPKRAETKDLSLPISRTYGRTLTSTITKPESKKEEPPLEKKPDLEKVSGLYTSRASFRPESEKPHSYEYKTRIPDYSPIESKPKVYTSSSLGSSPATSRYLGNKKGPGSSAGSTPNTPTTPSTDRNFILDKFEKASQQEFQDTEKKTVSVVTRGTSPTEPSTSVYVRARRADSARITEKTVIKPRIQPITADKGCQVDEIPQTRIGSRFSTYETDRIKPRPSYLGSTAIGTYGSANRYTNRTSYTPLSSKTEFRRSTSKDRDELFHRDTKENLTKPPPASYNCINAQISSRTELRRSVSKDRDEPYHREIYDHKAPPVSYTPISSRLGSEYKRSLSRERDLMSKRSEEPVKSVVVKSTDIPKILTKSSISASSSTSQVKGATNSLSSSVASEIAKKTSTSTSTSSPMRGVVVPPPPQKIDQTCPTKAEEKNKTSSIKTEESDTSVSVSEFSISKPSESKDKRTIQKSSQSPGNKSLQVSIQATDSPESESESDETATTTTDGDTEDDVEEITKSSEPSSVKRSITNFLQNRPDPSDVVASKSRVNFFKTASAAKIQFKHVESGERAWWMGSGSNVPEGVVQLVPSNKSIPDKNHLAPNYNLLNRQFSRDKDWLKNSSDEGSERSSTSPIPPRGSATSPLSQQHAKQQTKNESLMDASKYPLRRQWSDEKPWWMEDDTKSKSPEGCDPQNICDTYKISPMKSTSGKLTPDQTEEDEGLDVTPALRRRREQNQASLNEAPLGIPDYQKKEAEEQEPIDEKSFLTECQLECSVRDLTQKLAAVTNRGSNQMEEKISNVEGGDMSGMISRAKEGLIKAQSKQNALLEPQDDSLHVKDVAKSEIEIYWKELVDSLERPLILGDMDFTDLNSDDERDMDVRRNGNIPPPPPPILMMNGIGPPPAPGHTQNCPKPPPPPAVKNKKTVKLFWKEVVTSFPVQSSIWDEITSVAVDPAKLEHLFESKAKDLATKKHQEQNKTRAIVVLDNKRSNAINIGMTKLPPPRAIKAAVLKMDSSVVTKEGIEKLLTMLPTEEERIRIQDAQVANPELPLGTAEQFLLTLSSISELEARLRLWAFKMDFENTEKEICEPLQDLKQGMKLLRGSKTFRSILSTLLSIGNFLNGQEAKGFQIDYLSKVPEVKDTVNKHSLIHHLCVFVMENFPDSTDLYSEIGAVTRASKTDFDELAANVKKLEEDCKCSWNHLKIIAKQEGQTALKAKMSDFLADCAERIILIGIVHRRIMGRFRNFSAWLGIPHNRITTTRPHDLFRTISEFALEYRTTRERILQQMKRATHHREKSKSRSSLTVEQPTTKKLNSKEAKDDAKLRQLLVEDHSASETYGSTATWRRHKKPTQMAVSEVNGNDSEIIETLIKTAKQPSTNRGPIQDRRRSRMVERKISQS